MLVRATAGYGGVATIDPIVTVHPDNPDVLLEIVAPDESTGRGPMYGLTAEDLVARRIDPQPFIALGFLAPPASADTVAPSTVATPDPSPNGNGWNKGAVRVGLAANDNSGGSGVKEIHLTLAGATTQSRVGSGFQRQRRHRRRQGRRRFPYFAVDNAGNQEAAKTLTVRIDKTAPLLGGLPAPGCTLGSPDHRLVQVANVIPAEKGSGVAEFTLDVTSNEPESGTGDGDIAPDIVINGGVVQLRAERAGRWLRADLHDYGARIGPRRQCLNPDDDLRRAQRRPRPLIIAARGGDEHRRRPVRERTTYRSPKCLSIDFVGRPTYRRNNETSFYSQER
jgi:hypothetical protein